uniref:Uncharacterized protein n=1 Tax=viral metagenome TaxID=1070528 RepID=A0A6M3MGJ2_9ZZZZ
MSPILTIAKNITYSDYGSDILAGTIPPNSIINAISVQVPTAFNAPGTDLLQIGISGDTDYFAANTELATATSGATVTRTAASRGVISATASTDVYLEITHSGTSASAGSAYVIIECIQL